MKQSSLDEPNLEYESGRGILIKNEGAMDGSENDVDEGVFVNEPGMGGFPNNYDNNSRWDDPPEPRPDTPPPVKTKSND